MNYNLTLVFKVNIFCLTLASFVGCSPVPFPYLRKVPVGINQVYVKDARNDTFIENSQIEILYKKFEQSEAPFQPLLYSDTFTDTNSIFLPSDVDVLETYRKDINVQKTSSGKFKVNSKIKFASVQPLWAPALSHTIFNDYGVLITVKAEGYFPLRLWYYSLKKPYKKMSFDDKGWIELRKSGILFVTLNHKV